MDKSDDIDMIGIMLKAQKKAYHDALETAIRTGTSLVVCRKGKIVEIKPKFKYVLVPIKSSKKKKKSSKKK
jgi:hypothetical protein